MRTRRAAGGAPHAAFEHVVHSELMADLSGNHAIRVNDQYRIVFRFEGQDVFDVRCTDYH